MFKKLFLVFAKYIGSAGRGGNATFMRLAGEIAREADNVFGRRHGENKREQPTRTWLRDFTDFNF